MKKTIVNSKKYTQLCVSVRYVFRANFNDTYFIEDHKTELGTLDGKELSFFDPYYGNGKGSLAEVALAFVDDDKFVLYEKRADVIKKVEHDIMLEHIVCDDNDESTLIAAHISIR